MRIYWINQLADGSLAIMPAPGVGATLERDVGYWASEGIEVVVSLLESGEAGLDSDLEQSLCRKAEIEFLAFPIPDKEAPASMELAEKLARELARRVLEGRPVAIHCRAGIGRSSVIAACVLMCLGIDRAPALEMIRAARGLRVPETSAQAEWLEALEERLNRRS